MTVSIDRPPVNQSLLDEIVRRIRSVANVDRIIVFGSAATGTMNDDSDIDLMVLEEDPADLIQEAVRIRLELRHLGYPIDVFVMPSKRFEQLKNIVGTLAHPVLKDGKTIYERRN